MNPRSTVVIASDVAALACFGTGLALRSAWLLLAGWAFLTFSWAVIAWGLGPYRMFRRERLAPSASQAVELYAWCDGCQGKVPRGARYCPRCGRDVVS